MQGGHVQDYYFNNISRQKTHSMLVSCSIVVLLLRICLDQHHCIMMKIASVANINMHLVREEPFMSNL